MRDHGMYIEKDGVPVNILDTGIEGEDPTLAWASWFENSNLIVAKTEMGRVRVSTVFLGLDHNHSFEGPPLLYETMIFGGRHHQYQERHSTRQEADQGHQEAVDMVIRSSWWIRFMLAVHALFGMFRNRDSKRGLRS